MEKRNKIPFNKPFLTGKETHYIYDAVYNKSHLSGNGYYTKKCHEFFTTNYGFNSCLLTTSCTDALEMCALLIDIKPGDEVIVPSYTFVSSANAFVLHGAKIRFCDSKVDHPGIDETKIEDLITEKTKAIVIVHYAGIATDMDKVLDIAKRHNLFIIEDAAQAIDSYYINKKNERLPLGGIGHLGTFSFHETKNINSGEGGLLIINDEKLKDRAEVIWEKGTNRSAFFRGEIDKYSWIDKGSSFLPSELVSAFLYAQLENLKSIQSKRMRIWNSYYKKLKHLSDQGKFKIPYVPENSEHNAHMFYIVCKNLEERTNLIDYLRNKNIHAVFHYLSLNKSRYYQDKGPIVDLNNSDLYSECLLRLPFYYELNEEDQNFITNSIAEFYK